MGWLNRVGAGACRSGWRSRRSLTFTGMSVARVARKYGVNANQVFQWRSLHRHGRLLPPSTVEAQLLPVRLVEEPEKAEWEIAARVGKILI